MTNYNSEPDEIVQAENGLFTPDRKMAAMIYILYLGSLVIAVTGIVGVVIAYVYRGEASEIVQTHYRFQIRTFWMGFLFGVIGLLLTVVVLGILVWLFLLIWLVARCVIGLKYLNEGKPVPNPGSWLFGL